jgi:hypothetical protein
VGWSWSAVRLEPRVRKNVCNRSLGSRESGVPNQGEGIVIDGGSVSTLVLFRETDHLRAEPQALPQTSCWFKNQSDHIRATLCAC